MDAETRKNVRHCFKNKLLTCYLFRKKKSNFVPIHCVEVCKGSGDIVPLILNLSTKWRWVPTPVALLPEKKTGVHRIGGWVGPTTDVNFCKGKDLLPHRNYKKIITYNFYISLFSST
jgi:hypothetical protein